MISSETEYRKAREEVEHLTRWLARIEDREAAERKGLTAASIRRMISRVQEEIAEYEGASGPSSPRSRNGANPEDPGTEGPGPSPETDDQPG